MMNASQRKSTPINAEVALVVVSRTQLNGRIILQQYCTVTQRYSTGQRERTPIGEESNTALRYVDDARFRLPS